MNNLLFIVDQPNWAWDIKSKNIRKCFKKKFNIDIAYERVDNSKFCNIQKIKLKEYDIILVYGLYQYCLYESIIKSKKTKICQGISSCDEVKKRKDEKKIIQIAKKIEAVFVHNKFLLNQFKGKIKNLFFCPNGVDIKKFKLKTPINRDSKNLILGFVGNSTSRNKKGIYDFIIPACKNLKNVKIKYLDLAKSRTIAYSKMPGFYNAIDCYICTSETEGTPNPCLEAAACGRPLITTKVGNMPKLVKDNKNSLFIKRDIKDIRKKMIFYRDNRDVLIEHGKEIQKEIIKNWSWEKQVENYRRMFDAVLKN